MGKEAYRQAVEFFVDIVGRIPSEAWDGPGLGIWTIRDLVGHTSRSIAGLADVLPERAGKVDVHSAAHHYHISLAPDDIDDVIAERGKSAGEQLGPDPVQTVHNMAETILPQVAALPEDTIVRYNNGGIRLGDYLATRVLEITVHSMDLCVAMGQELEPPREALSVTLHLLADLGVDSGVGGKLALAATGRGVLPDRFSVLG